MTQFVITAGMLIKSNDPRYGWTAPILSVDATHATIKPKADGRLVTVAIRRIYQDSKSRAKGYNLVIENGAPVYYVPDQDKMVSSALDAAAQAHVEQRDKPEAMPFIGDRNRQPERQAPPPFGRLGA